MNSLNRDDFVRGMETVHPSSSGEGLKSSDFPPLQSKSPANNPKSSSKGPNASNSSSKSAVAGKEARNPNFTGSSTSVTASTSEAATKSSKEAMNPNAESSSAFGAAANSTKVDSNSSWSSLFTSGSAAKLQYHQPDFSNGKPSVFVPKAVHHKGISVWEECLVGQILGNSPSISQIQAVASQLWGRRDRVDVLKLDGGIFLFKFENP